MVADRDGLRTGNLGPARSATTMRRARSRRRTRRAPL